jgi:general secretion pathway protein J
MIVRAMKVLRRAWAAEAGFTLLEVLLATLLMTLILAALATVTAQWLPNWNRGIARVQRAERVAIGLDRIVADLSVAEQVAVNGDAKVPLFDGSELSVTFVRTALGPSARPGLEVIRLIEKADAQGLALVRERAPFMPMPSDGQIRFADQVVLLRAPYRVTFSYSGPDQVWQPTWRGQPRLPERIRLAVRDGASGQVLAVSGAVILHITAPAECARAKNAATCVMAGSKPQEAKKEGQQL